MRDRNLSDRRWQPQWSIGIYGGSSPWNLRPVDGATYPTFSAADIEDEPASFVADPFLLREDGCWHMFFELLNRASGRGEIGHADSTDGLVWRYCGVVLAEPFHLSYPHVFRVEGRYYMIPETQETSSIRLYEASSFPDLWILRGILLEGPFVDTSVLEHDGRWWLFTHRGGLSGLHLFHSDDLCGEWTRHPMSPMLTGNRHIARGAGRIVPYRNGLLRFTQDGIPSYGYCVRVLEIDDLSVTSYAEHELEQSPILKASGRGWNAIGMHHVDPQPLVSGGWLAAVDGAALAFC